MGKGWRSRALWGGEREERSEFVDESAEGRLIDSFFMFLEERGFWRGLLWCSEEGEDRVEWSSVESTIRGLLCSGVLMRRAVGGHLLRGIGTWVSSWLVDGMIARYMNTTSSVNISR